MMNPPLNNTPPDVPVTPPKPNIFPSAMVSDEEQTAIVNTCNEFKMNAQEHAREKKETMRTCYAYSKSKFVGGDMLPMPSTGLNEKDQNQNRPQIFMPMARQQMKTIFSQLKLTLFPNDEDYFRVRAKSEAGVEFEDILTDALKYIWRDALVTEKLGRSLQNMIWSGIFLSQPSVQDRQYEEWRFVPPGIDQFTGQPIEGFYESSKVDLPPMPDLDTMNPIDFFMDPNVTDYECFKWVYCTSKKTQEMLDSALYINKDKLIQITTKTVDDEKDGQMPSLQEYNELQREFKDIEPNVTYDLYYFPFLKTELKEYRNIIVGIAENNVLVRFHPNMMPRGMNPVVYCDWYTEPGNPYSTSPIEDLLDLQKCINILQNYKLEVLARAGNRFAARPNVDMSNLFGVVGGVAITENPKEDIVNFSGDYSEIAAIDNSIGIMKAEGQLVSGAQNTFQGSSNVDYKKTATELQINQENGISIIREIIEHISIVGIQRVLERLMYLCADLYSGPIAVPSDDRVTGERSFKQVDLSALKSGMFTIEMVNVNPSQSKQAQINGLMQLFQLVSENPMALFAGEPIIEKIGDLQGVKNIRDLIQQLKARMQGVQLQQAGMGAPPQPGMAGPPPPGVGPEGPPVQP